jgi:uncharacterized protein YdaU (DUF1376 family)
VAPWGRSGGTTPFDQLLERDESATKGLFVFSDTEEERRCENDLPKGGVLMFYYPHHIGDYRSATAHLSNEEDLAYRRLLDMYYDTEQPIPLDTHWVARRIRMGADVVESVLNDFFVTTDDGYRSGRCDKEIEAYKGRAEIARKNGQKGGRRKTKPEPTGSPAGTKLEPTGNPELTQDLTNQEPEPEPEPIVPNGTKAPTALGVDRLVADGLTEETAAEWLAHRKRVKAPMTPRSWSGIKSQAQKAELPLEEAILMSLRNGWRGFEAAWVRKAGSPQRQSSHSGFGQVDYTEGINDDGSFS